MADYDRIGSSEPIGKVILGYNRKSLEIKHWKEMIDNPRRPVVHWHVLKVNNNTNNNKPLFKNKRFALNEMFQQNASKFAIFHV